MAYNSPWLQDKVTGIVEVYNETSQEWVSLVNPSSMEWEVYDLDAGGSTGRTLDGSMLRDRVSVKEKLVLQFPPLMARDYTRMLNLISAQFFQCRYFSLRTGAVRVATMYVGDRSAKAYYNYQGTGTDLYTDVKFNFIER